MIIREAKTSDINQIVEVLIASLGTVDLELSPEIWNYKHVNNPFGKSLVLLAEENNKIIGVRAFMRWEWNFEGKTYNCFRAVDTATHPDHQGKGIFKKLTLGAIEKAEQNGDHFVFNTPNEKSRPGYLKMGWKEVNKIKVALRPAYHSFYKIQRPNIPYAVDMSCSEEEIDRLCTYWNENLSKRNKLFTPKTSKFLNWRYIQNPLQQYEVIARSGMFISAYIKKRKGIKELRISECIYNEKTKSEISKVVTQISKKFGAQVISYSPDTLNLNQNIINSNIGPILTLRELNLNQDEISLFSDISKWSYSIGDLELF